MPTVQPRSPNRLSSGSARTRLAIGAACLGLLGLIAAGSFEPQGAAAAGSTSLVGVRGTQLVAGGQPWKFLGYNDFRLPSRDSGYTCGGTHSDSEVDAELGRMHDASGATAVRTWFFQSYVAAGDWSSFDRVLSLADKHGLKVVAVLANQWGTCEQFDNGAEQYKSLAWYQGGYRSARYNGLPQTYRDYAVTTARRYANDPRIAFWQLMNEAEALDAGWNTPCQEASAASAIRNFADDVTAAVKSVDPGHLVSLGTIGGGQCGAAGGDYQYVHAGRVDLCEYHEYNAQPSPAPRGSPCASLSKPLFAGERGFLADGGTGTVTSATLASRAQYFGTDIRAVLDSGLAGYLIWECSAGSGSWGVGPGDPVEAVMRQISQSPPPKAPSTPPGSSPSGGAKSPSSPPVAASTSPHHGPATTATRATVPVDTASAANSEPVNAAQPHTGAATDAGAWEASRPPIRLAAGTTNTSTATVVLGPVGIAERIWLAVFVVVVAAILAGSAVALALASQFVRSMMPTTAQVRRL